jgi:hypothetical protein
MTKQTLAEWFEEVFTPRVEEEAAEDCPWDGEGEEWFMHGVGAALDEIADGIERGWLTTKGEIRAYAKQRAKDLNNVLIELDDYSGEQVYVEIDGKQSAFLKMSSKALYK